MITLTILYEIKSSLTALNKYTVIILHRTIDTETSILSPYYTLSRRHRGLLVQKMYSTVPYTHTSACNRVMDGSTEGLKAGKTRKKSGNTSTLNT